uniref:Uncharacterized protein n=1 Tax=Nelumbo nucifera TaxID=4432 RepID=A0A822ZRH0_NELNU|nr:TPA_asm: hypothetical protein HUJ06_017027 [Nelumbo nucifera]
MLSILGENGIIPTYYVDYSPFEVEEAINNEFEDAAAIRCSVDYKNGESQLYEIYVCVDKDANKMIPLVEEVNALKYQIPDEALQQMPDFQCRIDVLKEIGCIGADISDQGTDVLHVK